MGRREKPIEPGQGKAAEFAADLRMLRRRTGNVPYRELASRVPYSASSLSAAASGHRLPAWPVVAAYLEACGVTGTGEWHRRWRQAAGLPPEAEPAARPPAGPPPRPTAGTSFPFTGSAAGPARAPDPSSGEPPHGLPPGLPRQGTAAGAPYGPPSDAPWQDTEDGPGGAAEGVPHAPRGVPDPPTRFVGRDHEVEEVCRLLAEHRLLTLTGVGGVGKTRLAQRAARTAGLLLRDGACWVELAEVTSPDVLPYAVVEGLGLAPVPPHTTPTAHLADALRGREILLVLDNCEHLAAACARLAHLLLASTTGVRLLATSRLPLGPAAERLYVVPPLPEDASLALLTDRAALLADAAWSPDDVEHARAVIRRLDGLPLAIEFAARRLRALSPGQLLDRLDERLPLLSKGDPVAPERHRSLRAMLDWSHQLCTPAEQRLWARLSVFVGSISLEAAHAVWEVPRTGAETGPGEGARTGAGPGEETRTGGETRGGGETGPEELLDAVDGLIDHSLLLTEPGDGAGRRYTMLETVREYGRDRLARGGDLDDARTRHLLWFRDMVREAYERWAGPGQAARLRELGRELPNLRQALEYGVREDAEPAQARAALDIAHGLVWYWTATGAAEQGVGWLRRALAATAPADGDPVVRAARTRAMWACAFLAVFPADLEAAAGQAAEAAARARADGDQASVGWATTVTALATLTGGGVEESLDAFRAAVTDLRAAADRYGEQNALSILASALCATGRIEEALVCLERAFGLSREQDERWHRPYLHWVRAKTLIVERRLTGPDGALAHVLGVLEPQRDFADPRALALGHDTLAHCAWLLGRHREAARLFGASEARWPVEETRIAAYRVAALDTARCLEELRAALGEDAYRAARAEGAALPAEEAREWAIRFATDAM
ncbi:ATP-binding protein [Streptomyces sp. NPDC056600]|uniref:ATP-binding protein n=1 Tax=Streptomyces sp. NPDC056600 TaxID=3345874 RepID=UPI0036981FCB